MKRKGVILATVLLVMSILAVIAVALTWMGTGTLALAGAQVYQERAYYAASAGAWSTAGELETDAGFSGYAAPQTMSQGDEYTSAVYGAGDPVPAPVNQTVPGVAGEHFYILATGVSNGRRRHFGMLVRRTDSPFLVPALASDKVDLLQGSWTDAWNSTLGPYSNPIAKVVGVAHVGVLNNAPGQIQIDDESGVDPDVVPNPPFVKPTTGFSNIFTPGGNPGVVGGSGAANHAGVLAMPATPLTPVTLPLPSNATAVNVSGLTPLPPGAYGDVVIDGATAALQLGPGVYQFKTLTIQNGGKLLLDPLQASPTELYLESDLVMLDGGIANPTMKASLLSIKSNGGKVELVERWTEAYYTVYAPNADVIVKDRAQLYGSIVGRTIKLDDRSALHYDTALGSPSGSGTPNIVVLSQQRF
ncbi:MAG: hypothetical protein AB1758_09880 [Candidatus Eremiobacterota bacterium]